MGRHLVTVSEEPRAKRTDSLALWVPEDKILILVTVVFLDACHRVDGWPLRGPFRFVRVEASGGHTVLCYRHPHRFGNCRPYTGLKTVQTRAGGSRAGLGSD